MSAIASEPVSLADLFPAREETYSLDKGTLRARVFDMGLVHIEHFIGRIVNAAKAAIPSMKFTIDDAWDAKKKQQQLGAQTVAQLLPIVMGDLADLVGECVVLEYQAEPDAPWQSTAGGFKTLPSWLLVSVGTIWIEHNVTNAKKFSAWTASVARLIQAASASGASSVLETLSANLSPVGTAGATSSKTDSPASPTAVGV